MKETFSVVSPPPLQGVSYNTRKPWDFIIGASSFGPPQNPTAYWWDCQLVRALSSPHSTESVVAALEGRQARPLAETSSSSHSRSEARAAAGSRKPAKAGFCHEYNDGGCSVPSCPYKHACSFCGKPGHKVSACFGKHGKPTKRGFESREVQNQLAGAAGLVRPVKRDKKQRK